MTYDAGGFQLSKGLPNKSKIGYIRDEWGRIETIRYPSGRMMGPAMEFNVTSPSFSMAQASFKKICRNPQEYVRT